MASTVTRMKAWAYLGYRAVVAHPLRKLFRAEERDPRSRFLENYGGEGNVPTREEERTTLIAASRCIHCGLCEAFDPSLPALPRALYDGPSALPMAWARSAPDLRYLTEAIERLPRETLARGEAVCPTRVPLRAIHDYLTGKVKDLAAAGALDRKGAGPRTPSPGDAGSEQAGRDPGTGDTLPRTTSRKGKPPEDSGTSPRGGSA